jgi:hypothetical protein
VLRIFVAFKKSVTLARFESVNLGSNGKHSNHYSNEETNYVLFWFYCHRLHWAVYILSSVRELSGYGILVGKHLESGCLEID